MARVIVLDNTDRTFCKCSVEQSLSRKPLRSIQVQGEGARIHCLLEKAFKVIVEKEACGMGDIVMPVLVKYELMQQILLQKMM